MCYNPEIYIIKRAGYGGLWRLLNWVVGAGGFWRILTRETNHGEMGRQSRIPRMITILQELSRAGMISRINKKLGIVERIVPENPHPV
jgi:hypothetical protein